MNFDDIISKLSKKNAARIESVRLLKTLKKELREKSTSGLIAIENVKQVFQKIIEDTDLIYCPTFLVRLYLASCFSDALYLFAPNIPLYTTGELDAVFQLFSTVVSSNCQEDSTEYTIIQSIIDALNNTDSYLLIINREVSYEVIESMIKIKPVSNINDRYDSNFQNAIKFIVNLTNASTSSLILTEVSKLFSTNFNSSLIIQKILPLLSQNKQMEIVGSFQQYLNYSDFMRAFVKATEILQMQFGFIIQLLYPEIINEDDTQRMAVFALISQLFQHNKTEISNLSNLPNESNNISDDIKSVNFILSRNVDKCPKIRLIIIQIAADLIVSKNPIFLSNANNVIKSIHCDPNEAVRFAGLDMIWKLQKENLVSNASKGNDEINSDNDLYIFLNDKSSRIREKALLHLCEFLRLTKINENLSQNQNELCSNCLDKIIAYSFEKPGIEIFLAYSMLFDSFDSTELYEITFEKIKYMKVLNFIKTTSEYVKKYVETGNLSNNNLAKLLTKEIWKPFVPNKNILQIREKYRTQEAIQTILKITNEQFAKEFSVLTLKIPINVEKLIHSENKKMIKDFASFNSSIFIQHLPQILSRCNKECVSILPFISNHIFMNSMQSNDHTQKEIKGSNNVNNIFEIFNSLISASTPSSLIVFAKLLDKWNCCYWSKSKIWTVTKKDQILIFTFMGNQLELNYQKFDKIFSLKFFFFLSIPEIVPKYFYNDFKSDDIKSNQSNAISSKKKLVCDSSSSDFYAFDDKNRKSSSEKYNDQYIKWSLRISTLFNDDDIIKIHFHFIKAYPLQCLESLFRISNVISNNYHFSILLPNKSTTDVYHQFKSAQKKGKKLLNIISTKKFRKIASLLIDSEGEDSYANARYYSKMNEKFWILSMIDEALKNPKTPIEFLSLIVLGLLYKDKSSEDTINLNGNIQINEIRNKIYEKARLSLVYHINLRRKFANQDILLPSLMSQPKSDANEEKSDSQSKKAKKSSQENDEKFVSLAQNSLLISNQQVELVIPSFFNILAFFFFDQNCLINFKNIIDDLFAFIISNNQQKIIASYVINEIKATINPQSSFGKKMKELCDYAFLKTSRNALVIPINFHINQKFVVDKGNEM